MAFYYNHTITPANLGSPAADVTDYVFKIFIANMNADFVAALRSDGMDIRVSADGGVTWLDKDLVGFVQSPAAGYIAFRSTMDHTNNMVFYIQGDGVTSYANANTTYRVAIIGEWPCHETSGNINDRTANANHFTPTGITYGQSGLYGNAIGFDTSTDVLTRADTASVSALYPATLMFWVKSSDTDHDSDFFNKWSGTTREFALYLTGTTGKIREYMYDETTDKNNYATADADTNLNNNAIHWVVSKHDTSTKAPLFFKDNGAVAATQVTDASWSTIRDTSSSLLFGYNAGIGGASFLGVYNQLAIYAELISASESLAIYTMITNSATLGSKGATSGLVTGSPMYAYRQQQEFLK